MNASQLATAAIQKAQRTVTRPAKTATQALKWQGSGLNKNQHSPLQATAASIRRALQLQWPHTNFSVKLHRFSMGNSVTVSWPATYEDPNTKQVEQVTKQLLAGGLCSSMNLYVTRSHAWNDMSGQARFITVTPSRS